MLVESFRLKAGRSTGGHAQSLGIGPMTVFVGPNNSGKSKVLSELYMMLTNLNSEGLIVDQLRFTCAGNYDFANHEVETLDRHPDKTKDEVFVRAAGITRLFNREHLVSSIANPSSNLPTFMQWLSSKVVMIGGVNRTAMVASQVMGDLQLPPASSFQRIFRDDEKRGQVRAIIYDAFGLHLVFDPTNPPTLRLRLSETKPPNALVERGWHAEAVDFHKQADLIDQASDGVKAFCGMIVELIAGDPRILIIDEPEAFLHPALAFKLGKVIGNLALTQGKNVFTATHSSAFLLGCLQSSAATNVVRLTYTKKAATSRILPSRQLLEMMRHPLLRSSGVATGLFYEFVVVTEGDTDRAFYGEVNERLTSSRPDLGVSNCLFLNAQGKHTLHAILGPLRNLGIPTACIVDIDVLKEGGPVWARLLQAASVPSMLHSPWGDIRNRLRLSIIATGKDMKRDGGISLLDPTDQQAARELFDSLAAYGIFVVADGEVECWLKNLGSTGHGPAWLIHIFEKMGEDPNSLTYLRPSDNDVWEFISRIRLWLIDPARKGIPD